MSALTLQERIDELEEMTELQSEQIQQLQRWLKTAEAERDFHKSAAAQYSEQIQLLITERDRYKTALEFYAVKETFQITEVSERAGDPPLDGWRIIDDGSVARQALSPAATGQKEGE